MSINCTHEQCRNYFECQDRREGETWLPYPLENAPLECDRERAIRILLAEAMAMAAMAGGG